MFSEYLFEKYLKIREKFLKLLFSKVAELDIGLVL